MRNLMILIVLGVAEYATAIDTEITGHPLSLPSSADLVDQVINVDVSRHLVVLGALEKVNHILKPENSVMVQGIKSTFTYYPPEARRTQNVGEQIKPQLAQLGELVFECQGRTCGSSSNWANRILGKAILYGPEQYQRYYAVKLSEGYLSVYIGQRATRKIYLHIEVVDGSVEESFQ